MTVDDGNPLWLVALLLRTLRRVEVHDSDALVPDMTEFVFRAVVDFCDTFPACLEAQALPGLYHVLTAGYVPCIGHSHDMLSCSGCYGDQQDPYGTKPDDVTCWCCDPGSS